MLEAPVFIVILLALAGGWLLGRNSGAKQQKQTVESLPTSYMQSLTLLINEQPDEAIDKLIGVFEVNETTFDTHIALGNLSRNRGELDLAIKIHQNLLSRPNLGSKHHDIAHFELAKDYLRAGLLDRAEVLLTDLLEKNTDKQHQAQLLLISLYEDESEWQQALNVAEGLLPKRLLRPRTDDEQKILLRVTHFYCELAQDALNNKAYSQAEDLIAKTLLHDKGSLRGAYLKAQLAIFTSDDALLLKLLPQILSADSKLLFEALWLIEKATHAWPQARLISYLDDLYLDSGSEQVLRLLMEKVSAEKSIGLIEQRLHDKPTLSAITLWLQQARTLEAVKPEQRELLLRVLGQVHEHNKRYQCQNCGFKGMHFFWHCPTCKEWDTIEILHGEKGD